MEARMSRRMVVVTVVVALAAFAGGLVSGRVIYGRETRAVPERSVSPPRSSPTVSTPGTKRTAPNLEVVPDVAGLSLSQAAQVLVSMHLTVGDLVARADPYESGTVLSQGVRAGSLAAADRVDLVLSAGPRPRPVLIGGQRSVMVGGTCDLEFTPGPTPRPACVGGPLLVPLAPG
ncbi:MAG: PASTA domain-containing protein [Actinomycetota bacterium]